MQQNSVSKKEINKTKTSFFSRAEAQIQVLYLLDKQSTIELSPQPLKNKQQNKTKQILNGYILYLYLCFWMTKWYS